MNEAADRASGTARARPFGPRAVLFDVDGTGAAVDLARWLVSRRDSGLLSAVDVVPAATTVLVTVAHDPERDLVLDVVDGWVPGSTPPLAAGEVAIEVTYDGPDLDAVADMTGLTVAEVIARHQTSPFVGAFGGFSPGFTYLTGLDQRLTVPRRSTPRPEVASGAVAIAGPYGAVYPRPSPGGWHILGHTTAALWDATRAMPALVPPGTRVRFVARAEHT